MNEDRPYLQLPLPSYDDRRLFEEWQKQKEEEAKDNKKDRVVVIEV